MYSMYQVVVASTGGLARIRGLRHHSMRRQECLMVPEQAILHRHATYTTGLFTCMCSRRSYSREYGSMHCLGLGGEQGLRPIASTDDQSFAAHGVLSIMNMLVSGTDPQSRQRSRGNLTFYERHAQVYGESMLRGIRYTNKLICPPDRH